MEGEILNSSKPHGLTLTAHGTVRNIHTWLAVGTSDVVLTVETFPSSCSGSPQSIARQGHVGRQFPFGSDLMDSRVLRRGQERRSKSQSKGWVHIRPSLETAEMQEHPRERGNQVWGLEMRMQCTTEKPIFSVHILFHNTAYIKEEQE